VLVFIDGGTRSGLDVLKALRLGPGPAWEPAQANRISEVENGGNSLMISIWQT
jgi:hypothetical protein